MSLRRALDRLHADRATENMVREVLQLMRVHSGQPLSATEVARRLERPEASVAVILLELADAYVVRREGRSYCYMSDPVIEMDVERFVRRSEGISALVQTNVAKFRDRYGYK
jgi:predicted transcriptional regulator